MKYLLVLLVLLFAIWLWRHNREQARRNTPAPPQRATPPERSPVHMVACLQCGVHLPAQEAVHGTQGAYCSEAHRRVREG